MKVVALFARLHLLLLQPSLIAGLGESTPSGTTVSVDLALSEEAQLAGLRLNHIRIKKLRPLGATCVHDTSSSLDEFVGIYRETLDGWGPLPTTSSIATTSPNLAIFVGRTYTCFACVLNDEAIAAGLFRACGGIVQYHLGAT